MNSARIQISNLNFAYDASSNKASRPLLTIPSLTIQSGEKVFIHGPSGSGKSTLLGLLSGILAPNRGDILIGKQSINGMSLAERDHFRGSQIGYIFQIFNLIPYLSVYENIMLPLQISSIKRSRLTESPESTIVDLTKRLGIADLLHKPVTEISVGQQQRVAAARAFMGDPPVIIADEPTSSLDNDHRQRFCEILTAEANRYQATVLFVSHDTSLRKLFDRSIDLKDFCPVKKAL